MDNVVKYREIREDPLKCDALDAQTFQILAGLLITDSRGYVGKTDQRILEYFPVKVVLARIEAMGLPIKFTHTGIGALILLSSGVVGRAVAILIDCLNNLPENTEVTATHLCEIYPQGFYTEEVFGQYIDEVLKPKKMKWSEIY